MAGNAAWRRIRLLGLAAGGVLLSSLTLRAIEQNVVRDTIGVLAMVVCLICAVGAVCDSLLASGWQRKHVTGTCRTCGYDLRATPERCPECGTMAAAGPIQIDRSRIPARLRVPLAVIGVIAAIVVLGFLVVTIGF